MIIIQSKVNIKYIIVNKRYTNIYRINIVINNNLINNNDYIKVYKRYTNIFHISIIINILI